MRALTRILSLALALTLISCSPSKYDNVAFQGVSTYAINGLQSVDLGLKIYNDAPHPITVTKGEVVVSIGRNELVALHLVAPVVIPNSGAVEVVSSWSIELNDPTLLLGGSSALVRSLDRLEVSYKIRARGRLFAHTLHGGDIKLSDILNDIKINVK